MNKIFLYFLTIIFVISISLIEGKDKKLGKKIELKEKTKISEIFGEPDKYVGKKVLVEGEVLDVCKNAGCWMFIKSDKPEQKVKIKVKDGVIVFPQDAIGKTALIQGEVYKIELDQKTAIEFKQHEAEESGVKFDSTTVTGPMTIYQIKGQGAVIKNLK